MRQEEEEEREEEEEEEGQDECGTFKMMSIRLGLSSP